LRKPTHTCDPCHPLPAHLTSCIFPDVHDRSSRERGGAAAGGRPLRSRSEPAGMTAVLGDK
jgi:hypothetical protein